MRSSLDECLSARTALEGECADLRSFVGEVGEWAEGMLEVPELVAVRKDGEEGEEMRGVLHGEGDEVRRPSLLSSRSAAACPR